MAEKTMTMQGMCESLYQTATAMTTSIEIAEKVAEEVNEEIEGLDALSAYIEKVLARVKITLLDTVLRVESEKGDTKIELRKVYLRVKSYASQKDMKLPIKTLLIGAYQSAILYF